MIIFVGEKTERIELEGNGIYVISTLIEQLLKLVIGF